MTADPNPTPDPIPTPAPDTTPAPDPAPTPTPDDGGKGGKDALLADLAKERDKRQALEGRLTEFQTKQQEQLDAIAKLVGLKTDDEPADPAKLAEQIATEQDNTRQAHRELAVYRRAGKAEANPDALLDSASFLRSIADLDPTDEAAVDAAIAKAVEANPGLKAAPQTPSFNGGRTALPTPQSAGTLGSAIATKIAAQSR